jgi:transcription initiation factor TFIIIB Brf1 subunit/transcription initiation factor TFIIB
VVEKHIKLLLHYLIAGVPEVMKCPFCGGNPVIYDPQFSEYICSHCGAVLEDRPLVDNVSEPRVSDEYKHIGSFIINPNYRRLALKNINVVYATKQRIVRLAVSLLHDACGALGVPWSVCLSAEKRLLSAVDRLRGELVGRPKASHLLRLLTGLSLYVTVRELGYAVTLSDVALVIGVGAWRLYAVLWKYRDVLGYRYADVIEPYLVRVMRALSKRLAPDQVEEVAKLARELMEKYPVVSGKPLHRVLAYTIVACRLLGLDVSVKSLVRELRVSEHIYDKAIKLLRAIESLEKHTEK